MQGVLGIATDATVFEAVSPDHGVVFTRPWVVTLILDLVGYRPEEDLASKVAVEPSFGHGAFVVEMVRRLVESRERFGRSWEDLESAIVAVELDPLSVARTRESLIALLGEAGAPGRVAEELVTAWVRVGDFLLDHDLFALEADWVIGNPPYVRPESIGESRLRTYRQLYATMVGRADLYVAFFERGLSLLKPEGQLGFICADRWTLNAYGRGLRNLITSRYAVDALIDMHHADAFDDEVLAYPAVVTIRSGTSRGTAVAAITGRLTVDQASALARTARKTQVGAAVPGVRKIGRWFTGDDPWPSGSPERIALLRDLENRFPVLAEAGVSVGIGIATGNDRVFITQDTDAVEPDRLLPLILGRDTQSGSPQWSGNYLVNPWNGNGLVDLERHPRLRAYFHEHAPALLGRHVAKRAPAAWYRTIDRVIEGLTERPKLLIPDIKGTLHPVLEPGGLYPHHNLYFMTSEDWPIEALGGLLLSDVAEYFVSSYAVRMAGGFLRFQAQYLRRIRIPPASTVSDRMMESLAMAFAGRDKQAASQLAYDLYKIDGLPE